MLWCIPQAKYCVPILELAMFCVLKVAPSASPRSAATIPMRNAHHRHHAKYIQELLVSIKAKSMYRHHAKYIQELLVSIKAMSMYRHHAKYI
eukprot:1565810-Pyramimonas_sp.AAC.1